MLQKPDSFRATGPRPVAQRPAPSAGSSSGALETVRPASVSQQTMRPVGRATQDDGAERRVLLVDDDEAVSRAQRRVLAAAGYEIETVADGAAAADRVMQTSFAAVVSDVHLPATSGVDLLRTIRAYDADLPVILTSGAPTVESAAAAVELGALLYLVKPVESELLLRSVAKAVEQRRKARATREAVQLVAGATVARDDTRAALARRFDAALGSVRTIFHPIVDARSNDVLGYEAAFRVSDPSFADAHELVAAAERLGRMGDLGRHVRRDALIGFRKVPSKDALLFLNLHPSELYDSGLYDADSELVRMAGRVVFELSERGGIDKIEDARDRASVLLFHGFRIAIDELGSGCGITSFVGFEPSFAKLDPAIVRGIDESPLLEHVVRAQVDMCKRMGMRVIAMGVDNARELRMLRKLGCDAAQGVFIGRPVELAASWNAAAS